MALEPSFEPAGPEAGVGGVRSERDAAEILEAHRCDAAAAKLRRLREQRQTAADLMKPRARRAEESYRAFRNAQDAFDRLKADFARGAVVKREIQPVPFMQRTEAGQTHVGATKTRVRPDEERLAREKKNLDKLEAEMRRDRDARHTAEQIFQGIGGVVSDIERALQELPRGARLKPWTGTPPKPHKGESLADCLARHEAACMAVATEIEMVETAPRPSSDVLAGVFAQVDDLADRGRPNAFDAIENGSLQWPSLRETVQVFGADGVALAGGVRIPDSLALICWACNDLVKEKLRAEVAAVADDEAALSDSDRREKLADLREKHLLAMRHVEHFLDAAEQAGTQVFRARGNSVEAILAIELVGGKRHG